MKILVPVQRTTCHKHLNDYGTISKLKLWTQGRGYSTTFVMSPAYIGTSGILSRNLIQLNVPKICIRGYIYKTYISKYVVYVQIKVKRKIWNLCFKTLHVFLLAYCQNYYWFQNPSTSINLCSTFRVKFP